MKQIVADLPDFLQSIQKNFVDFQNGVGYEEYKSEFMCSKLSHVLADACHMPKNAAMAIIMPAWCKYLLRRNVDYLAVFARMVWDVPEDVISVSAAAQEGIAHFQNFLCQCGLAVTLREYGIRNIDSKNLAEQVCNTDKEFFIENGMELRDVQSIYELAKG